jgi:ribosomal protein S1
MVRGEIIEKDDKSITVKLPDNSSKIIMISQTTNINKASSATIADITKGDQVMIFGKTNTDGSVTATNIQVGTGMRFERKDQ